MKPLKSGDSELDSLLLKIEALVAFSKLVKDIDKETDAAIRAMIIAAENPLNPLTLQ